MDEADKGWLMTTIGVSGWMFLLVPAHLGCPRQNPESRKMVVYVCVCFMAQVSQYQKGKTNLDLLQQQKVSGSAISWAICKSAPLPRQVTMPAFHNCTELMWTPLPQSKDTIWPSYSLLRYLLPFSTNHNLGFFIFTLIPLFSILVLNVWNVFYCCRKIHIF